MTQDEIIRMAREAGVIGGFDEVHPSIERLADLAFAAGAAHEKKFWMEQIEVECNEAVLAEREACATACEENRWGNLGAGCAAAIRARGEK